MKILMERIRQRGDWLDGRTPRERVMVLVSVLAVVGFVAHLFFWGPQSRKRAEASDRIAQLESTLTELNDQADLIQARSQEDPDRDNRLRLEQLQAELGLLDKRLEALTIDLITPPEMANLLHTLLIRQEGMRLVSLENLPPVQLLPEGKKIYEDQKAEGTDMEGTNIYRHPVRIVISGTYLQALNYLQILEKLPRKLFWQDLEIVVGEYPRAEISLTVFTLSYRKGWIGV